MRITLVVTIEAEQGMLLGEIVREGLRDLEVEINNTLNKFGASPQHVRITSYKETENG